MNRQRLVVIGAGGHAREVRWLAEAITEDAGSSASYEFAGFVVSDLARTSPHDSADEILGDTSWLLDNRGSFDCLALSVGYAAPRLKVAGELEP